MVISGLNSRLKCLNFKEIKKFKDYEIKYNSNISCYKATKEMISLIC